MTSPRVPEEPRQRLQFTAKTAGVGTAAFSPLDEKPLPVVTDIATAHIDPAK